MLYHVHLVFNPTIGSIVIVQKRQKWGYITEALSIFILFFFLGHNINFFQLIFVGAHHIAISMIFVAFFENQK